MTLTFVLVQLLRVLGNATVVQEAVLGCCLPTDITSHSRSSAAVLEVSYGVPWVTNVYRQPVWRA